VSAEEIEDTREKVLQKHAMEIVDEISGEEARS
jgi:hypothetical protein